MSPLILSPRRRHLFSGVACPIVVICPRIVSSSPSLVPLVVSSGRGAGRGDVIRIVSSARRGQASRRAGVSMSSISSISSMSSMSFVFSSRGWHCDMAFRRHSFRWQASRRRRFRVRLVVPSLPVWRTSVRYTDTVGAFIIRGGVHHPRALALLSLISKLGRHRPAHIVIHPSRYRVMPLVLSPVIVSSRPRRLIATVPISVMIGGKQRGRQRGGAKREIIVDNA